VVELESETIANNREEVKRSPAFSLSINKEEWSKLLHHPKLVAYNRNPSNAEKSCVTVILLDNDPSKGDLISVAEAILHSVGTKIGREILPYFNGQSNNSDGSGSGGGGSVSNSLADCLGGHGLCHPDYYFNIQCALHNLQNVLKSGVKTVFEVGGIEKCNMMQLLHSCKDLEK
jgi:hypothetical protein